MPLSIRIYKKIAPYVFAAFFVFFFGIMPAHGVVFESGIPGIEAAAPGKALPSDITTYIGFLYTFVLGIVGIAGFISLVIWGTVWVATGIIDKKQMALESIKNTFIGIGIALTAYIILNTINPDLITLKSPSLQTPEAAKTTSSQILPSAATASTPDGGQCASQEQCYPGSICGELQKNESGMVTTLGKCVRAATTSWEGVCAQNDNSSTACDNNAGCKYCTMKDNSTRCLDKNNSYNNCTK